MEKMPYRPELDPAMPSQPLAPPAPLDLPTEPRRVKGHFTD